MPTTNDPGWATIAFGPESEGLSVALTSLCQLSLAVRLELRDGRRLDGVMSEMVSEHLAIRGFDNQLAIHTDELMLILVADIARVEVS
jgi:transcriptional antiterminator Rof (Rho-off)